MRLTLGIICTLFGGFGFFTQTLSWMNLELAQKLGFQEKTKEIDPIFQNAEVYTAIWDTVVLWTLFVSGILIITNNSWWPFISLIAGGIYFDTAGREAAKYLSLIKSDVKVGTTKNKKMALLCYLVMAIIGLWLMLYSLWIIKIAIFV